LKKNGLHVLMVLDHGEQHLVFCNRGFAKQNVGF